MTLSARETAFVLAALRRLQSTVDIGGPAAIAHWEHFGEHAPLESTEIDALCDRINGADDQPCPDPYDCPCCGVGCAVICPDCGYSLIGG